MDTTRPEEFDVFASRLERLALLKEKNLLDEEEYKELRSLLFAETKRAMLVPRDAVVEPNKTAEPLPYSPIPYGKLHSLIVNLITPAYAGEADNPKERMFRAMSEMAGKQALYPVDPQLLTMLIEIVSAPLPGTLGSSPGPAESGLLKRLAQLTELATEIRDARDTSPAAKAIAETAQQSTTQAVEKLDVERSKDINTSLSGLWKKFVLKDVEGAFEGGAAAVPALVGILAVPVVAAAAFGVVVGAGVRSAIAHVERPANPA